MNTRKKLRRIERDLNGIVAAITQASGRRSKRIAKIATGKVVSVASMGGMLMFITAFGTASTGTAIGTLSGAAATSAQLYWIGSIFGMGAVAGAFILPAIGVILGFLALFYLSHSLVGRPRKPERMEEFEVRALFAAMQMIDPISRYSDEGMPEPQSEELRVFALEGLLPLVGLIESRSDTLKNGSDTDKAWKSFEDTLALLPRRKLRKHCRRLNKVASKLAKPRKWSGAKGWLLSLLRSHSSA